MGKKKVWNRQATIFSALRRAHRNSPEYREALLLAKEEYFITCKNGNQARRVRFKCKNCTEKKSRKLVKVDHRDPVVALTGFTTLDSFADRLFCGVGGLDILCDTCHKYKTKIENRERKRIKDERSKDGKKTA